MTRDAGCEIRGPYNRSPMREALVETSACAPSLDARSDCYGENSPRRNQIADLIGELTRSRWRRAATSRTNSPSTTAYPRTTRHLRAERTTDLQERFQWASQRHGGSGSPDRGHKVSLRWTCGVATATGGPTPTAAAFHAYEDRYGSQIRTHYRGTSERDRNHGAETTHLPPTSSRSWSRST